MDKFYKKIDTKIDINIFKDIINSGVEFKSPFDDKNSVLNSYSYSDKSKEQNHCGVQFYYLQKCDYENGVKDRMSEIYIKSMMRNNKKQNLMAEYKMLEDNYDKFCIELNELNFNINIEKHKDAISHLQKQLGDVYRIRLTKLLAGTCIPWHKDETPSEYSRLIIPVISDDECISGFKDSEDLHYTNLPADGSVFWTNGKKDHAVFNVSKNDRYAIVLTIKKQLLFVQ